MNNVIDTKNEYRDRTRVEIENLVPWSVGFQARTIQGSRFEGVIVPGCAYKEDGTYHPSVFRRLPIRSLNQAEPFW